MALSKTKLNREGNDVMVQAGDRSKQSQAGHTLCYFWPIFLWLWISVHKAWDRAVGLLFGFRTQKCGAQEIQTQLRPYIDTKLFYFVYLLPF